MATRGNRDELLAVELAAGKTYADAGKVIGLSETSVVRRMRQSDFRALVCDMRRRMIDTAIGKFASALTQAADSLVGLLGSEKEMVRLRAAVAIADLFVRLGQHAEFDARLLYLEQRYGNIDKPSWEAFESFEVSSNGRH
jgi:hypothetical protein